MNSKSAVALMAALMAAPLAALLLSVAGCQKAAEPPKADVPAAAGEFIPMPRMYGPQHKPPSVLDDTRKSPAIVKVG